MAPSAVATATELLGTPASKSCVIDIAAMKFSSMLDR